MNLDGGYVPDWMAEHFPRLEALGADITRVYGCGCFGCVFPSLKDERWVFKLSDDRREGGAWEWIWKQQKQGLPGMDAFVFVSHVEHLGEGRTLVKREEVDLSVRPGDVTDFMRKSPSPHFSSLQSHGRQYGHRSKRHPELARESAEEYEKNARALSKFKDFGVLSRGILMAAERGVYFGDLHSHNVGRTVVDWGTDIRKPGTWVIFDPGMTSIEEGCPTHPRTKKGRLTKKERQARPKPISRRGWK